MVRFVALLVTRLCLVPQMLWLGLEFSWQLARQSLAYIGSQAEPGNQFICYICCRDTALPCPSRSLIMTPRFPVMHRCHSVIFQQMTVFNRRINYPVIAAFHPTYHFAFQIS